MRADLIRAVHDKTHGHCHFCGDKVILGHHGKTTSIHVRGAWEMDHVIQRKKGGASNPDNYLPACWRCNRLRWHRKGKDLRRLIQLGLVANDEIKKATELGRVLRAKLAERKTTTNARRAKAARRTR